MIILQIIILLIIFVICLILINEIFSGLFGKKESIMGKVKTFFKKFKKLIIFICSGIAIGIVATVFIILKILKKEDISKEIKDLKKLKEKLDEGKINNITNTDINKWYRQFQRNRKGKN